MEQNGDSEMHAVVDYANQFGDRIAKLEGHLGTISDVNNELRTVQASLAEYASLERRVEALENRMSQNSSQGADHTGEIKKLEIQCSTQQSEISNLRAALAELMERVATLESSKSAVKSAVGSSTARPSATPARGKPSSIPPARPQAQTSARKPVTATGPSHGRAKQPIAKGSPSHLKEEGVLRTYLRGRPLTHHLPSDVRDSYDFTAKLDAPDANLQLEWVYGYRGKDCRDNVLLLPSGELCYFIASVVVLFNPETNKQRHYLGHNDDIKSIALHPDKVTIATGQLAGHDKKEGKAHVRIWNSTTLETLQVLGLGHFEKSVCTLAFSKVDGGQFLATVDESGDHLLAVWDWQKAKKLNEVKSSGDPVLVVEWSPVEANALVSCGKNHLNFWSLDNGSLNKKQGVYQKYEKPKIVICLTFLANGDLVTGDSNGTVFIWQSNAQKISNAIMNAHEGGVFFVSVGPNGNLFTGGGKDAKLVQWNANFEVEKMIEIPECFGACRAIALAPSSIFIGTTKNCLLRAKSMDSPELMPIIQGQFDEFWALAAHPCNHQFLSGGTDNQVILWDAMTKKAVWSTKVQFQISCADFYPLLSDSSIAPVVALGTTSGKWLVMDVAKHEVIAVHADSGGEQVQCVSYSPDGNLVAVGSRDNFVYVYQVFDAGQRYSRVGKCVGHSSFVLHLDWSEDNTLIRTMSGDYEVLYWSAADCKQVTSAKRPDLWDVAWASHTVCLGWDVIGIWPEDADGTDINACGWDHKRQLVATADDSGKVNLFTFPSCQLNAKAKTYGGHSSHVTEVKFLFDDSRLISAGGKDSAVLQWALS